MRETEDLRGPGEEAVCSLQCLKEHLSGRVCQIQQTAIQTSTYGLRKMFRRVLCFLKQKKKTIKDKNNRMKIREFIVVF